MKQIEGDRAAEVLPVVSETDAQKKGSTAAKSRHEERKNAGEFQSDQKSHNDTNI